MTYDYIKEEVRFDSPQEERDYNNHMAEFGPGVPGTPSHPDDCPSQSEAFSFLFLSFIHALVFSLLLILCLFSKY